jgi:hypothetical protein
MGGNIAGIYGAQIFRADDKPKYRRGFSINIAILVVGLCLAVGRYIDDLFRRHRAAKKLHGGSISETIEGKTEEILPSDVRPQPILFESNLKPVVSEAVK